MSRKHALPRLALSLAAVIVAAACGGTSDLGGTTTPYQPCGGRACGAPCTLCDPRTASCSDTVLRYCNASGVCGLPFPVCPRPAQCEEDGDCPQIESCLVCTDGSTACPEARCLDGECVTRFPECPAECKTADDCPPLGAPCQLCPDGSVVCPGFDCVDGHCTLRDQRCKDYDPCAGKACGASCTLCDPLDPDCAETAVLKYCDASGACTMAYPVCPPPPACTSDSDCPAVGACPQCPGGECAELTCVDAQCVFTCPPAPPRECTSAADCPQVGMPCLLCPDGWTACPSVDCVDGRCTAEFPTCDDRDPCADKPCGEACDPCGGLCASPVAMYCDSSGRCTVGVPACAAAGGPEHAAEHSSSRSR